MVDLMGVWDSVGRDIDVRSRLNRVEGLLGIDEDLRGLMFSINGRIGQVVSESPSPGLTYYCDAPGGLDLGGQGTDVWLRAQKVADEEDLRRMREQEAARRTRTEENTSGGFLSRRYWRPQQLITRGDDNV